MFVNKQKLRVRFGVKCTFVKKFLFSVLAIHKRQQDKISDQVLRGAKVDAEANCELYNEEIVENKANEALVKAMSDWEKIPAMQATRDYRYPIHCLDTVDGSFYWDDSMQQLPSDGAFIEVHKESFRNMIW